MIIIYTTCKNKKEAEKITRILLKQKLVACVNYFPINSLYWWSSKLVKDKEVGMIIKTLEKNYQKIEKLIKKHHSYSIPCIISWKISKVEKKYFNWLKKETR